MYNKKCNENQLIEKCGDVEFEIEKILEHSNKLYNYIQNNLFLEKNIDDIMINICNMKKAKDLLKNRFMLNSLNCIRIGNNKKSLEKTLNYVEAIKSIKEIIELLKVLSNNQSKFELVNDLILKAKTLIGSVPVNFLEKVIIFKKFELELKKFSNKSSENMIEEFQKIITDYLSGSFEILPYVKIGNVSVILKILSINFIKMQIFVFCYLS